MDDQLLQKVKKKKRRTIGIIAVIAALVILGIAGFSIRGGSLFGDSNAGKTVAKQSEETASEQGSESAAVIGTGTDGIVTIEIDCSDLSKQMDRLEKESIASCIPADGVMLAPTEYAFDEGETVYDCLYEVCRARDIQMESSEDAVYKSRYVEGIGHLYEMDAGKRSGWTYYVDGEMPDYGCSKCRLADGQKIRWVYVVDYTE